MIFLRCLIEPVCDTGLADRCGEFLEDIREMLNFLFSYSLPCVDAVFCQYSKVETSGFHLNL